VTEKERQVEEIEDEIEFVKVVSMFLSLYIVLLPDIIMFLSLAILHLLGWIDISSPAVEALIGAMGIVGFTYYTLYHSYLSYLYLKRAQILQRLTRKGIAEIAYNVFFATLFVAGAIFSIIMLVSAIQRWFR
jgi:hypothetical protein